MAAQFSVLMTFPCTLIIYKLLPITAAGGMSTLMAPYACVLLRHRLPHQLVGRHPTLLRACMVFHPPAYSSSCLLVM